MNRSFKLFEHIIHHHEVVDVNKIHEEHLSAGEKIADAFATGIGSWDFILIQCFVMCIWVILNSAITMLRWDPYPYVLLNLFLSMEAALSAPIIMMSQNRQAAKDRLVAENDYHTDVANTAHILQMIEHLNSQDSELLKQTAIIIQILQHLESKE